MRRATRIYVACVLSLVVFGGTQAPTRLWAQPATASESEQREGITGGMGLGLGSLEIGNEGHGTLNYDLQFGGYISHQWALQLEIWGGVHNDDDFHISNFNRGISAQYWMADRKIWWKAMVGASTIKTSIADTELTSFAGAALGGGGGWVFYEPGNYHFDARFRLSVEGFKDSRENAVALAFGVGVSYF